MKKVAFLVMALFLLFGAYAQQQKKDFKVDPRLTEILGADKINDLRANNPKQLLIEHINLTYYCALAFKPSGPEGTYILKDDLKNHLKAGKTCDYQAIIQDGAINRYDFDLEQDKLLPVLYPMGNTGAYIMVNSKQWFDDQKRAILLENGFGLY
jgi:hypothetical protein